MGIKDCRHKGLQELYKTGRTARIGKRYHKNILMILDFLAAIHHIDDCTGVKDFHPLAGSRKNTYSMHVTGNYCITFEWDGQDVGHIDFEDYH
jgi:proteic killer suppression protein